MPAKYDGGKPGTDSFSKLADRLYQKAKAKKSKMKKQSVPSKIKVK